MNALGSSATNPIVIGDLDTDLEDTTHLHQPQDGTLAIRPIVISDSDSDNEESIPSYIPRDWPDNIRYWNNNKNPENIQCPDVVLGRCACSRDCSPHTCINAKCAMYCDPSNCNSGDTCSNRLQDYKTLRIMRCIKGFGVMTIADIPKGIVLGEYCGKMVPQSKLMAPQVNRGFVLAVKSRSTSAEPVFINAFPGASLCRFVNHSCNPNSKFEELQRNDKENGRCDE